MSFHRLPPPPPSPTHSARSRKRSSTDSHRRRKHSYPPSTPSLHWKLFFESPQCRGSGGRTTMVASARKLAAGLWQLQLAGGRRGSCDEQVQRIEASMCPAPTGSTTTTKYGEHNKNEGRLVSHVTSGLRHGALHNKVRTVDQQHDEPLRVPSGYVVQSELSRARFRIRELESERSGFRKKVGRLLREIEEAKRVWRAKEAEKLCAVFDGMKDELRRERMSRRKMEIMNSRLVVELIDVKSHAERFRKLYKNEKRSREVVEAVCNELAKRVGEQKEEFEKLRTNSIRVEAEIEKERRMMQVAEVWREERVQMKLNDAKFALESKYVEILNFISQLDALLTSESSSSTNAIEPRLPEETNEVANKMNNNVNDGEDEFVHEPRGSRDLHTIREEIRAVGGCARVIEPCNDQTANLDNEFNSSHDDKNNNNNKASKCNLKESKNHLISAITYGDDQVKRTVRESSLIRSDDPIVDRGGCRDQGCVGEWSLNELLNPHITGGMKGREVEWPQGFRKSSPLKAKGSQARIERQKAKLRSVVIKHRTRH